MMMITMYGDGNEDQIQLLHTKKDKKQDDTV